MSTTTYISLLRGINLGSHNRIKMESLRTSLSALGFEQVRTYIQRGNAVFCCGALPTSKLSEKIERQILNDFNLTVPVISLTAEEMNRTIRNNPFLQQAGIDISRLHVSFLSDNPVRSAIKKLDALAAGLDQFCCSAKVVYLHCPGGYGETRLSNGALGKLLSVRATTRNWKTVNNLYQMATELD
jgi:uncharacterized protein (DUF1697 family)